MTEKGMRWIRREMLSPHEMRLIQTAFGMCVEHTTSEPSRHAFVKIARNLTHIDCIIIGEDFD